MANEDGQPNLWLVSLLRGGLVPTRELAMKIAELIFLEIQGPEIVNLERPFSVADEGDRWTITGTTGRMPLWDLKGPARISIAKKDCRILEFVITAHRFVPPPGWDDIIGAAGTGSE